METFPANPQGHAPCAAVVGELVGAIVGDHVSPALVGALVWTRTYIRFLTTLDLVGPKYAVQHTLESEL